MNVGEPFNPYGLFNGSYIPEAVCKYRALSPGAKLVYGRLCRFAGEDGKAFPAVATVGTELGISESQARQYIRELDRRRFVRIDRTDGARSNYVFLWHAAFEGDLGEVRKDFTTRRKAEPLQLTEPLQKTTGVQETTGVPLQKTGRVPLQLTEPEESQLRQSGKRVTPTRARGIADEDRFAEFRRRAEAYGISGSGPDWDQARSWEWRRLDLDQRTAAIAGIEARIAANAEDDPARKALPKNYLKQRMWERAIRKDARKADPFETDDPPIIRRMM
jgi:hypothetical protein